MNFFKAIHQIADACKYTMIAYFVGILALVLLALFLLRKKHNYHPDKTISGNRALRSSLIIGVMMGMWFFYMAIVACAEGDPCDLLWELNCSPGARLSYAVIAFSCTIGFLAALVWDFKSRKKEDRLED